MLTTSPVAMPSPVPGWAPSCTTASPVATAARTDEVELLVLRELVDRVEDPQPRAHGALRIVLVRHGRAEDRHHGVADELLDRAAEPLDLAGDALRGTGGAWHARPPGRRGRRLP